MDGLKYIFIYVTINLDFQQTGLRDAWRGDCFVSLSVIYQLMSLKLNGICGGGWNWR